MRDDPGRWGRYLAHSREREQLRIGWVSATVTVGPQLTDGETFEDAQEAVDMVGMGM